MVQEEDDAPRTGRVRDNTVRVAVISAIGTVLAAGLTAVGSFMSGLVTYTGPGAAPLVPSSTATPGQRGGGNGTATGSASVTDLKTVTGSSTVRSGPQRVNTRPYADTLYQYAECVNKKNLIYQLDRRYEHFEATIGPSDDSQSGYSVFFTVTVDDREVLKEQVAVGESKPIRADVGGGYRMTLSVISDRPEGRCPGSDLIAVWAEPRLVSR